MCSIPGLPTPGSEVPVLITKVEPNSFGLFVLWVKIDDERKKSYEQMRSEIQVSERRFRRSEARPKDLCLVCISDTWHRARIVSIKKDTYEVFLIDQGQSHRTTSEALAWAKSDSFFLPPEIKCCLLANVLLIEHIWPEKYERFLLNLPGKKFTGLVQQVLMPDRLILVDIPVLSSHMFSLGATMKITADEFKCLVMKSLVLLKRETPKPLRGPTRAGDLKGQMPTQDRYYYPELLLGSYVTVEVTEVTDELNIFCKLLIFSKALNVVSEQLQQHCEPSSEFEEEQPQTCGDLCAVRGTDGKWYRSLLKQDIESDCGAVKVLHVDVGRTESVPIGDIRPLPGKFLRMPVVTYPCFLAGAVPSGRNWTTVERDYLKSMLLNQSMMAKFNRPGKPQDAYEVMLFAVNATCINNCFLERTGVVPLSMSEQDQHIFSLFVRSLSDQQDEDLRSPKASVAVGGAEDGSNSDLKVSQGQNTCEDTVLTVGSSVGVKVSYIKSPEKFWCQMTEGQDALRCLMQDLQKHYGSVKPQPLMESFCIARNPDDNMWHRARIANNHSPVVDVVFIDHGRTCEVPLRDVRPIDPAFLQLNAQAFKCCLINPIKAARLSTAEFQKFVASPASSETALKCTVKAVEYDKEGLPLHVVDIETEYGSASKILASIAPVPPSRYNSPTHNIQIGVKEDMWVTSAETVSNFYCQLDRNSTLYNEMMKDVVEHLDHKVGLDHPLELGSICIAKYPNNKWFRAEVAEISPKLKVHFVDFGDILEVNDTDVCPFPSQASVAMTTPFLAIPLALSEVPAEVPQEVNRWFSNLAVGGQFTISPVAMGEKGKVIVELFEESLSVNRLVRQMISRNRQNTPDRSERTMKPSVDFSKEDTKSTEQKGACRIEEAGNRQKAGFICMQSSHSQVRQLPLVSCPDSKVNVSTDKMPDIVLYTLEGAYVTCNSGPHFFWCQRDNADELGKIAELAQEAGRARQDISLEELEPGSPCLALFSDDNRWYRAQVIQKTDSFLRVVFVDFGNESEVEFKDVTSLPHSLMEFITQAFLCHLDGFDESSGSWDKAAYDDFYHLVADKPLKVTAVSYDPNSEYGVPQYAVKIHCNNLDINYMMEKNWRSGNLSEENATKVIDEASAEEIPTRSKATHVSDGDNMCLYKEPKISKRKTTTAFVSCVSEPHFFWCQYANSEGLDKVSALVQELAQTHQLINPETLFPGSPCLALFTNDNSWYRAHVIQKVDDGFHILFIDYGDESDVGVGSVRPLPPSLLEIPPEAFLCCLQGFDKSKGYWASEVYNDFYKLLRDKSLTLTVCGRGRHPESSFPQYSVEIECDGVSVNALMKKYWRERDTDESLAGNMESVNLDDTEAVEEDVGV